MRARSRLVPLALVLVVLAGCMNPPADKVDEPPLETLREVWFGAVPDPADAEAEILRIAAYDGVEARTIGTSVEGRPIHTVTMGEGPFVLWVMGRLHGNEPTGMMAILLVMELLAAPDVTVPDDAPMILHDLVAHRDLLKERITFVFVPLGNPDGAHAFQRGNVAGVDLNRDFFAFSQPESQVIRDAYWDVWPDACIDLHNIGASDNDFEAYGPTGPLLEPVTEGLLVRDSWFAVHEIDAQGGRASGMNEDYRAPAPADAYPWPEAYHPGTHDFFCSARGAPGWTPEGSITGSANGAADAVSSWSARLHAITFAASTFHWAGVYDGVVPVVQKGGGHGAAGSWEHPLGPEVAGRDLRLQFVWRPEGPTYADHELVPITFRVIDPAGETREHKTAPGSWSSTQLYPNAAPGNYRVEWESASILHAAEVGGRAYTTNATVRLADVERTADGLRVHAEEDAPGPVHVALTDVADVGAWDDVAFSVAPHAVRDFDGPAHARSVAEWRFVLEPGAEVLISMAGLADPETGPWRFTATSGGHVHMGTATEPRVAGAPSHVH